MSNIVQEAMTVADEVAPTVPAVEIAKAAVETAANPSPTNILADIELVISLTKQLKAAVNGKHPILLELIKAIF